MRTGVVLIPSPLQRLREGHVTLIQHVHVDIATVESVKVAGRLAPERLTVGLVPTTEARRLLDGISGRGTSVEIGVKGLGATVFLSESSGI